MLHFHKYSRIPIYYSNIRSIETNIQISVDIPKNNILIIDKSILSFLQVVETIFLNTNIPIKLSKVVYNLHKTAQNFSDLMKTELIFSWCILK